MSKNSKAQIIATIGPASKDKETIRKMIECQMDAARLNLSWGSHEEHLKYIKEIRGAAADLQRRIPIILDLSGPRKQEGRGHELDTSLKDTITRKDIADLDFGIANEVDYIAVSYVAKDEDLHEIIDRMEKSGRHIPIISKIERREALDDLDDIIRFSGAVMVARGDLGKSLPIEKLPEIQERIIKKVREANKPVIVATELLLSMTENPEPTRAEINDIAQAILQGTDALMLSEETASGKHPIESVAMMERIIKETETREEFEIHKL